LSGVFGKEVGSGEERGPCQAISCFTPKKPGKKKYSPGKECCRRINIESGARGQTNKAAAPYEKKTLLDREENLQKRGLAKRNKVWQMTTLAPNEGVCQKKKSILRVKILQEGKEKDEIARLRRRKQATNKEASVKKSLPVGLLGV